MIGMKISVEWLFESFSEDQFRSWADEGINRLAWTDLPVQGGGGGGGAELYLNIMSH